MVTRKQVKEDLKEIRYYYSKQKQFESAKCVVESAVVEKVNRYNQAIKNAPARLYDLYISVYTQNNTLYAMTYEWDFCYEYIKDINNQLCDYLVKFFNEVQ
jgi:hypothetical protein